MLPPDCKSTDLFGQINDRNIDSLKVDLGGEKRSYRVSYPGFAIRIYNYNKEPLSYQFLDGSGNVIWPINTTSNPNQQTLDPTMK